MFSLRRLTVQAARARPSSLSSSTFAISRASRPHNLAELRTFESLLQMRWNSSNGVTEIPPEEQSAGATVGSPLVGGRMDDHQIDRRPQRAPAPPSDELYIGNMSFYTTEDHLNQLASEYGTVSIVRLVYDRRGLSKGFGYIKYMSVEEATAAREQLDKKNVDGRFLKVQFAARAHKYGVYSEPTKTLFLGNISYEITDEDLNELFKDIRNCTDVRVAVDRRTSQPRGFAHCDFIDVESAIRAKELLDGAVVRGRNIRADFSSHHAGQGERGMAVAPGKTDWSHEPRIRKTSSKREAGFRSVKPSSAEAADVEAAGAESVGGESASIEAAIKAAENKPTDAM